MKSNNIVAETLRTARGIGEMLAAGLLGCPRWAFNLILFAAGTMVAAYLTHELFQAVPHIDDGVAALYQARIFQHAKLVWPVDPSIKPFFDTFGVITPIGKPGYWSGMYPPGWPLLLTVGLWIKAPWLVNPVLGGLLIVAVSELGRELYNEKVARVAGIMAVASPFLAVVSATHLSHTPAALFCTVAWWCALRLLRTGRTRYALIGGAAIGMTLLVRPETAVVIGSVILLGVLVQIRRVIVLWRQLLVATAVAAMAAGVLIGFQFIAVGKAGTFGHAVEMQSKVRLGFGRVGDSSWIHTPQKATLHGSKRLKELNRQLLGWPLPAVVLLLAPFYLLRPSFRDLWLLASLVALAGFFAFYWYWEEWLPGRYLFSATPMLLVLCARGWWVWNERLRRLPVISALPKWVLLIGVTYALVVAGPRYREFFGPHHGDVESWLPKVVDAHGISNAVIFMRSTGRLKHSGLWNDFYATGFMRNTLNLDGEVIYARDGEDKDVGIPNERLIERYPGRHYYAYEFDQHDMEPRLYRLIVEDGQVRARIPITAPGSDRTAGYATR